MSKKHLYLVDGSGYIFRAYYAPNLNKLTNPKGLSIGAVYGLTAMLLKLRQDVTDAEEPTHIAVIFDAARATFRNDIYADYKANRDEPPEDLIPQFPIVREAVKALSLPSIEMEGFEADDIIATYARQARENDWDVTIVSSDKDLMQLLGGGVEMLDPMKNVRLGVDAVAEKFGVGPEKMIEVQSLMGDSVDNVPGVPGIGPKIAAELIQQYGDLETLLSRATEIKQKKRRENLIEFADQARISKQLVTLKHDVPVSEGLDDFELTPLAPTPLLDFLEEHGFRTLKARWGKALGVEEDGALREPGGTQSAPSETSYTCVTTMEALDRWIEQINDVGAVCVDTETTGLDAMAVDLVGISLSVEPGKACYIPLAHRGKDGEGLALDGDAPDQLPLKDVLAKLKPALEDPAVLKIGQNLKFDMLILARYGIDVGPIDDTMLISYALDSGKGGHGMDELAQRHLGLQTTPFSEVAGKGKSQITFDLVPLDKATHYAAEDADITLRLHKALKPRLPLEGLASVYEVLERPLVPVITAMEKAGIKVDRQMLSRLSGEFAQRLGGLEAEITALAGETFNIGSPKQLGDILFGKLDLEPKPKKTKTGAYSTGAEVLETLAAESGHPLPPKVLEWRQLSKLKSTYTDALQNQINAETGRVHTSFSLAATTTGRLSSNEPNLQNIPIRTEEGRRIREAFVAEEGHVLIAADYSQIELRLLAHIADIPALKDAFAQGQDIHAMTASQVFDVPMEDMTSEIRRQAKAINFGIIYGISAFGLARQLGIARGEAKDFIDRYFERFPGIRRYMDDTIAFCKDTGYVETLFGRRAHIRGINDKNPNMRGFSERAAINAPIQGSAADIIRRAMIRMPGALQEAGLGNVDMLLQVHDELIFEVARADADKAAKVIADVMEAAPAPRLELSVPLTVEAGIGDTWGQAH
ncbi:MAG: DNA polymerase I [Pseudomonadota bacterium]